ncbi:hypothetical protein PG997_001040 [Apiospora hydei]|uniref:Uncharacterized protein n=1 Tax=Apiospora hydei TaxID=1337664 RepID=A0ABR1XCC8_9PEZI
MGNVKSAKDVEGYVLNIPIELLLSPRVILLRLAREQSQGSGEIGQRARGPHGPGVDNAAQAGLGRAPGAFVEAAVDAAGFQDDFHQLLGPFEVALVPNNTVQPGICDVPPEITVSHPFCQTVQGAKQHNQKSLDSVVVAPTECDKARIRSEEEVGVSVQDVVVEDQIGAHEVPARRGQGGSA